MTLLSHCANLSPSNAAKLGYGGLPAAIELSAGTAEATRFRAAIIISPSTSYVSVQAGSINHKNSKARYFWSLKVLTLFFLPAQTFFCIFGHTWSIAKQSCNFPITSDVDEFLC